MNAAMPLARSVRMVDAAAACSVNGPTSTRVSGARRSPPTAMVTAYWRSRCTTWIAASTVRKAPTWTQNTGRAAGATPGARGAGASLGGLVFTTAETLATAGGSGGGVTVRMAATVSAAASGGGL